MSVRAVHLAAGDAIFAGGEGVDALARACLAPPPAPARLELDVLPAPVRVPYRPVVDGRTPLERVCRLATRTLDAAGLSPAARARTGLFLGSSSSNVALHEQRYAEERAAGGAAIAFRHPYQGELAEQVARACGARGPRYTFMTACSAGANALLYAARLIRQGRLDHALVLGVELHNRVSLVGFHSLLLLSPTQCRPFDAARDGIVLGEAVGAVLLSHAPRAPAGAGWQLRGGGTLCDTFHPTNPAPGRIADTMRRALADAGCGVADIGLVKAHGTGTPSNDLAEGQGLREVFGERLPPLTSVKPALGHTLGACGVLETLALAACVDRGLLPATAGFVTPDPALQIAPVAENLAVARAPLLLNYFGFGGNNCSLVLAPC